MQIEIVWLSYPATYHVLEDNFVFNELPGQIHLVVGNVGGILYVGHYQYRVGADPLQILPQGRNLT